MRKLCSNLALLILTASLAACGGSNDAAFQSPSSGPGAGTGSGTGAVATITVTSSTATLPPDGTMANITVTATDKNNVAVAGATVSFQASAGTLAVTNATTDASGLATAKLSANGVAASTVITVSAGVGSVSGKTTVTVASTQRTLTLTISVPQIPSAAGSAPATIKALVVDGSSNVVPGALVTFQASSGALTVTQGTTDASGTAIATLSAGTNPQNRTITVTATSGTSSQNIMVPVVGTTLTVSGPTSLVQGAQGAYSVTLNDSGGNGISGQSVTLTSASGNALTPATVITSPTGTATFTMTANNSGSDTITANWPGVTGTEKVVVSSQAFNLTAPTAGANVNVGVATPLTFTWTSGGVGQSGTVFFSTSRGAVSVPSVVVTNGTSAPVTISSVTAGPATISATAVQAGVTVATAQVSMNFVATVPNAISVQASPSAVPVSGTSTIIATVIDVNNNPVLGAIVDFNITDSTGGQLSATTAQTNAQGQATVTYTATSKSSTANGVLIGALVQGTAISSQTTLTVGGQTIFLSLGTGNTIVTLNSTQYELPYTVQAVDSQGNGVNGVTITFSLQSVAYGIGTYVWQSPVWGIVPTAYNCKPTQVEEYNGVINPQPPPNGVTPVLTNIPGSVASTDVGQAVTANGTAAVNLIYPKDHAGWVQVALTATATVSGTQNSTTATFWLPGAAADYTNQAIPPPGVDSPYGTTSVVCY
jgi:Bacterial Ig-like domain (group 1)